MRTRNEIEKDFNTSMPLRKEEFLEYQRQKLILEVLLDILSQLKELKGFYA